MRRENHSGPASRAFTAAICRGLNIPESIWLFTFLISLMLSASPATIPRRHPDMLWALLREFSSRQQSFAPSVSSIDRGSLLSMKL